MLFLEDSTTSHTNVVSVINEILVKQTTAQKHRPLRHRESMKDKELNIGIGYNICLLITSQ